MSTDGPIAYGPIGSSNLEIVQSSSGELGGLAGLTQFSQTWQPETRIELTLVGSSVLALVYGQTSTVPLSLGGSTESEYVVGVRTYTFDVSVPLSINSSSVLKTLIETNSQGDLTLAGISQIIFNDLEVSSLELELAGESTVSVTRASFSQGDLEITGDSVFKNLLGVDSTAPLEFGGAVVAVQTVEAVSRGDLTLSGNTDSGEIKDITVISQGDLEISASTELNRVLRFTSSGQLRIAGTTTTVVQRPTITQVASSGALQISGTTALSGLLLTLDSSVDLEIDVDNAFQINVTPLEKPHGGWRELKDSRQVAYISQVRIARPQVRAEVGFYPAPPAQAETPPPAPRPQGPFGKFLDQYGNRLTYRYDSSTATVQFGIQSTVELDNSGVRNQQIQQDDAWLLGFDDDNLMLDSARTQQVIQQFHDEKAEHLRRLQEDKDLLGITD